MDGRFAALEEMKKMLEDKQKTTTSKTTGNHGREGNLNLFRGREISEVEVLEGEDGMPPLEPLSREEMSQAYDRRGADFVGRREEIPRRAADFEGRRRDYDEGFKRGMICGNGSSRNNRTKMEEDRMGGVLGDVGGDAANMSLAW
ncbi:hypothetical protein M5K25_019711 [Dendrobium thyrsiflorum]|uniref:Uncharacterized protein n=1 Tax=Dendrobium thyrsiflorum TaxID=117978 RepID=A0ABD0UMK9_DENTH